MLPLPLLPELLVAVFATGSDRRNHRRTAATWSSFFLVASCRSCWRYGAVVMVAAAAGQGKNEFVRRSRVFEFRLVEWCVIVERELV
ncbi:uncharacterized protein DS421_12g364630 [Arachis hypogaea]|nr:uncharacterized protein DS421_12g364630 [Arachis hypogaea]